MAVKHRIKAQKSVHARMAAPSRSSAKTVPARSIADPVRQQLHALTKTLRDIEGIVIVSAGALRDAGEYTGAIVAHILRTQVSNRLSLEIDRTVKVLGRELREAGDQ